MVCIVYENTKWGVLLLSETLNKKRNFLFFLPSSFLNNVLVVHYTHEILMQMTSILELEQKELLHKWQHPCTEFTQACLCVCTVCTMYATSCCFFNCCSGKQQQIPMTFSQAKISVPQFWMALIGFLYEYWSSSVTPWPVVSLLSIMFRTGR